MPIVFDAPVEPDALTAFVREVPTPSIHALTALFGRRDVADNRVDFAEIVRTNRTARFRSWDGRIHVSQRDIATENYVKLPPLSSSLSMGEYERLQLEFARTGGTRQAALVQSIYNDGQNLTNEVLNRMEQAWGDVLTDGKLSINENGLVSEADYGVPAGHIVAPAGALWSNVTTSVPLTDLLLWSDTYNTTNGFRPASFITSLATQRLLQRNKEVIDAVYGATAAKTRVTSTELNDLLSSEGLPTMRDPYDTQVDVDGSTVRVIAADKVILLPDDPTQIGYTAYGVTATALELVDSNESDLSFEDAPGIVGVVEKVGPPYRQFTYVDACGMPVIVAGKQLLIADVA